jgi:hypothetical protein
MLLPYRKFDLLSKKKFLQHSESRGVFVNDINFEHLIKQKIIRDIKGRYPKYLIYEIWKYKSLFAEKNSSVTFELNKIKFAKLTIKRHRRIMRLVYAINDYVMKAQEALKPTIEDILYDPDYDKKEKQKSITMVVEDYRKNAIVDLQRLVHKVINDLQKTKNRNFFLESATLNPITLLIERKKETKNIIEQFDLLSFFIKEYCIEFLMEDIYKIKGDFNFYGMRRFGRNLENFANIEKSRASEYSQLSRSDRLAQDCWNQITVLKWFLEDLHGQKCDLGIHKNCSFCKKPLFKGLSKTGRPIKYHSREDNKECYRARMNFLKKISRKRKN